MKKIYQILLVSLLFLGTLSFNACDDNPDPAEPYGKVVFKFEHKINGADIQFDKMVYKNDAGNDYEVSEIQWFISDVVLHKTNGDTQLLNGWTFYHYIDTDIPSTQTWDVPDKIGIGEYKSVSFIFGFRGEKNEPYMFVNHPLSAMYWPSHLGGDEGGFHYLKLNGFWLMESNNYRRGYQYHLGVGQKQDSNLVRIKDANGSYIFVQNWFEITLDNSSFTLAENGKKQITLRMNVENWFKNPNSYDFDYFGSETMEYQNALQAIKENGVDVFSVSDISDL
ncbi:MAG: MbnP family protein [Bacteroidota bacterium]|nr:MbnP family protein [Bacteroidota bacterium]